MVRTAPPRGRQSHRWGRSACPRKACPIRPAADSAMAMSSSNFLTLSALMQNNWKARLKTDSQNIQLKKLEWEEQNWNPTWQSWVPVKKRRQNKEKLDPYLILYAKINSGCIQRSKCENQGLNIFGKKLKEKEFYDLKGREGFLKRSYRKQKPCRKIWMNVATSVKEKIH